MGKTNDGKNIFVDKRTLVFGKPVVSRTETVQYVVDKFGWKNLSIGISAYYGFWAWLVGRLTGRKVIYYCIDFYSPVMKEGFFDGIFIWLSWQMDKFLIKHSDIVWDISDRINEGRLEYGNYKALSHIVPMCYPPEDFRFNQGNGVWDIVFVGLAPYGLELLDKLKIDYNWIRGNLDKKTMLGVISTCCRIGIGIWEKRGNNYYGDPGKMKLYLACGIPLITTDNNPSAELVKKYQCGIVCDYNQESVKNALDNILANYNYYKNNVRKTWEVINADNVFGNKGILE